MLRWGWRGLTINRQLLLAVNVPLVIVLAAFFALNYSGRISRLEREKRIALADEAKTLYESVKAVSPGGPEAIRQLIDDVCARMNTSESPGHHIAVEWAGRLMQSTAHGPSSPGTVAAMKIAASRESDSSLVARRMVASSFVGPRGTIYVSELRESIDAAARKELVRQLMAVAIAFGVAALVVNVVLRRVVTRPVRRLVKTLRRIGEGRLDVVARVHSCREMRYLADQVDAMAAKLEASERQRRAQMVKARQMQQYLRPSIDSLDGIEVAELFEPTEDVGGDYYDLIPLSNRQYLLCVADVAGHGVPAAMAATLLKAFVSEAAKRSGSPAAILTEVNRRYCNYVMIGHFATMALVRIDVANKQLTYANAGHELPIIHCGSEGSRRLELGDLVLGVDEDVLYQEATVDVGGGTTIVLMTDGVTEAFNPDDEQFGSRRVELSLRATGDDGAKQILWRIEGALDRFRSGQPALDDTTLLVTKIL